MKSARAALAFTLLEAMIALIVLAGVASACLQLRAQSLRARAAAAEAASRDAALDDLLRRAVGGLLPDPQRAETEEGAVFVAWRGDLHGDPYEVTRELVLAPNPAAGLPASGQDAERAREIWLARWRATWRGHTVEEWRGP